MHAVADGLTSEAVASWALARGRSPADVERLSGEVLLLAISRLVQAIHRERVVVTGTVRPAPDGPRLVLGSRPEVELPIHAPLPYGRYEARGLPELVEGGRRERLQTAEAFLAALRRAAGDGDPELLGRLERDFRNSLGNLLLNRLLDDELPHDSAALEPGFEGHAVYPFPALRTGPSIEDVATCSSFAARPVALPLARLADHHFVSVEHEDTEAFFARWAGTDGGPGILPLHPWNVALSPVLDAARRLGMAEALDEVVTATPLASQRTCRVGLTGWDVKLAVDATITGEHRLLFPANVLNAPVVSALAVRAVQELGPPELALQRDVASIVHPDAEIGRHVAAIVRAPVALGPGESVVAALQLWTGRRLADDLLDLADPVAALLDYARVVLRGPVELYAHAGLMFEPHLQNAVIRIRDRRATGLVLRDVDGTILDAEQVPGLLRAAGLRLAVEVWDAMPAPEEGSMRLSHALHHAHLGQVIAHLALRHGADPAELAACVETVWDDILRPLRGRARERAATVRRQAASVKCMLTTRLGRGAPLAFIE